MVESATDRSPPECDTPALLSPALVPWAVVSVGPWPGSGVQEVV